METDTFIYDDRLAELDYGPFEGKPIMESGKEMWAFLKDPYRTPPPDGVESLPHVMERVQDFFREIVRETPEEFSILVSSHGLALGTLFRSFYLEQGAVPPEQIQLAHAGLYVSLKRGDSWSIPAIVD